MTHETAFILGMDLLMISVASIALYFIWRAHRLGQENATLRHDRDIAQIMLANAEFEAALSRSELCDQVAAERAEEYALLSYCVRWSHNLPEDVRERLLGWHQRDCEGRLAS